MDRRAGRQGRKAAEKGAENFSLACDNRPQVFLHCFSPISYSICTSTRRALVRLGNPSRKKYIVAFESDHL